MLSTFNKTLNMTEVFPVKGKRNTKQVFQLTCFIRVSDEESFHVELRFSQSGWRVRFTIDNLHRPGDRQQHTEHQG